MKKSLLLIFMISLFTITFVVIDKASAQSCTPPSGYSMIDCFNDKTTGATYSVYKAENTPSATTATVAVDPTNSSNKAILFSNKNYGHYLRLNVTLPCNRTLNDYQAISFRVYCPTGLGTSQTLKVGINGVLSDVTNNGSNTLTSWTTLERTFPAGFSTYSGLNTFTLELGFRTSAKDYYIDDVMLKEKVGIPICLNTAPTAMPADEITSSTFNANWQTLANAESYRLDVATDESFNNFVTGYNNLEVGNVLTYEVLGLNSGTDYYYRVRGVALGYSGPSSSTIIVNTLRGYVPSDLDPIETNDPTPETISGTRFFVIENFENRNIDATLSVNNSSNANSSVKANPTGSSTKSAYVRVTNWDGYLRLNVQLPDGKVLSDYSKLSFDEYLQSGYDQSSKDIRVFFNSVQQFSVASGITTTNVWTTREFNLAGKSASSPFTLDLGMRTANGSYFIDNVRLTEIPATTATAATHIYATSFKAQWSLFEGSTAYFLDVATNNTFTNMVSGYNNLNVGNVANHVVTGLTPGTTYYYRVRGTNTSTQSNTITVATKAGTTAASHFATRASGNISDAAIWQSSNNNTGWINATAAPTGDAKSIRVLKNHELTVDDNFSAAEIIVRAGGKLNIASGKQLSLTGRIFLESDADGTATLMNEGTVTVGEHAVVKQYFGTARNWYVSSPVATALAPETNITRYYEYVEAGNNNTEGQPAGSTAFWKGLNTGHTMAVGKGYIAQVNAGVTVEFSGALNNNISYPVTVTRTASAGSSAGFNLVGNPYPAYLDWSNVIAEPLNANIGTTFWYRTKNTENAYTFTTHNGTSGITVTGSANTEITRLIPPMQAFWVRVNNNIESTQLVLKKTMLNHRDVANNKFKAPQNDANAVLRLQISNGNRDDETVLYFNNKASIAFDHYDSPKMFSNNAVIPEIYTRAGNERLVINGMNGYDFNTMIPLGFVAGQAGSFSIRSSELQNFDSDTQVYLLDKSSNSQFNLTTGESYSFTSDATSTEDRFAVLFKSATGTSSVGDNAVSGMYLTAQNGRLTLQLNTAIDNAQATVFTAAGQSIHSQAVSAPTTVLNKSLDAGVYVVKIVNGGRTTVLRTIMH